MSTKGKPAMTSRDLSHGESCSCSLMYLTVCDMRRPEAHRLDCPRRLALQIARGDFPVRPTPAGDRVEALRDVLDALVDELESPAGVNPETLALASTVLREQRKIDAEARQEHPSA